jgi:hypothetical protein
VIDWIHLIAPRWTCHPARRLDHAIIVDVDLGTGDFDDLADHLAARTDHITDLVGRDGWFRCAGQFAQLPRALAEGALAISPRMCRRPPLACSRAIFMISSVMP